MTLKSWDYLLLTSFLAICRFAEPGIYLPSAFFGCECPDYFLVVLTSVLPYLVRVLASPLE